jgi:hypothetical protein
MRFTGVVYTALNSALDDYCIAAGIDRGSPQHLQAARMVMRLFSSGLSTPDELRAALLQRLPPPSSRASGAVLQSVEG